jgi:FYVE zinc finger/Zn-finger in Ran binding protein and others
MSQDSNFKVDLDELFGLKPIQQSNHSVPLTPPIPPIPPPSYNFIMGSKTDNNSEMQRIVPRLEQIPEQKHEEQKKDLKVIRDFLDKKVDDKNTFFAANTNSSNKIGEEKEEKKGQKIDYWSCQICTFSNKMENNKCEMCHYPKGSLNAKQIKKESNDESQNFWVCSVCTLHNPLNKYICMVCHTENHKMKQNLQQQTHAKHPASQSQQRQQPMQHTVQNQIIPKKKCSNSQCNNCEAKFAFYRNKYYCVKCKYVFCDDCTSRRIITVRGGSPERVCDTCFNQMTSLKPVFKQISKNKN